MKAKHKVFVGVVVAGAVAIPVIIAAGFFASGGGHMLGGLPAALALVGACGIAALAALVAFFVFVPPRVSLSILGLLVLIVLALLGIDRIRVAGQDQRNQAEARQRHEQWDQVEGLAKSPSPENREKFKQLLVTYADQPSLRQQAILSAVRNLGPEAAWAAPHLVALCRRDAVGTWHNPYNPETYRALAAIGEPALAVFLEMATDPDSDVRGAGARILGLMGEQAHLRPRVVAPLAAMTRDRNETVASRAARELEDLGDEALPYLSDVLRDPRPEVRKHAISYFTSRPSPWDAANLERVLMLVDDPDESVADTALRSLIDQGDSARPYLARLRDHQKAFVREKVADYFQARQ